LSSPTHGIGPTPFLKKPFMELFNILSAVTASNFSAPTVSFG
jgi:hypothetical protein